MSGRTGHRPPRLSRWWLRTVARHEDRDAVSLDLDEEFHSMLAEGHPVAHARSWYRRQVWTSVVPLLRSRLRGATEGLGLRSGWGLDLKLALRMLIKTPGLTAVAVVALAVGIPIGLAPNHAALLFTAPPPVPEGDRLYVIKNYDRQAADWEGSTLSDYEGWQGRLGSFEALGAVRRRGFNVRVEGAEAVGPSVQGAEATASALSMLRVPPWLGRLPDPNDERQGAPEVVLVSHTFWVDRLASDSTAVGTARIELGGVPHTVIGVMPPGFHFHYQVQLWVPIQQPTTAGDAGPSWVVFGRLADGVSWQTAEAEAVGIGPALDPERPGERAERLRPAVVPFAEGLFGLGRGGLGEEQGFVLIQGIALFVLVVACLNIGMLMLVRTLSRSREIAVRTALGARRSRIVAQLFVEALVLAVVAAGAGLVVADQAAARLHFMQRLLPYWFDLGVRPTTVAWALALAVLSATVVGIVPALKATGHSVQRSIQRASAARTGVRFGGVSSLLIVADVALAVVAVGIAIGMSDSLRSAAGGEATVAAGEYLAVQVSRQDGGRLGAFEERLVARLESEPRVRAIAVADRLPGMDGGGPRFEVLGREVAMGGDARRASLIRVRPGFFAALEQPVASGRALRALDRSPDAGHVVVNSQFVVEFFAGRDPVGSYIRPVPRDGEVAPPEAGLAAADDGWLEIVGTVGDIRRSASERREGPMVYTAMPEESVGRIALALRVPEDPTSFAPVVRELVHALDPTVVMEEPQVLADVESFDDNVLGWFVLGVQSMIAILIAMAASGTYALLSFTVGQRTREIAVRSALGSPKGAVLMAIGRRALMQIGAGATLGMMATGAFYYLATRDGWVPVVSPLLLTVAAGLAVFLVVAVVAFVGPTRRGLRIEPSRALQG